MNERVKPDIDFALFKRINLVQRNHARLFFQSAAITRDFMQNRPVVPDDVIRSSVNEVQEYRTALKMTQESVTDSLSVMGAFNETGNIGHDELPTIKVDHAQYRVGRRERVIGNPWTGVGNSGKKCRLSGIRQTNESGVRDHFQPKPDRTLDSSLPGVGAARRLIPR